MLIRIGNLNAMTTAKQLAELFRPFGRVLSSKIIGGPKGRCNGMGVIEMDSSSGRHAVKSLNRLLFMNSYIAVDEIWM